jgi:hypothetical protein
MAEFQDQAAVVSGANVPLPAPLPVVQGDFDWDVRDFDGFRLFMMEELAARFPERTQWTPADVEVALVEVLAAVLDQLSDCLDRVAAEASLATARRPDSVRRLLRLIGYDAVAIARERELPPFDEPRQSGQEDVEALIGARRLEQYWLEYPQAMDAARRAGPRAIETQQRFATLEDYRQGMAAHPLVAGVEVQEHWGGSWPVVQLSLTLVEALRLDQTLAEAPPATVADVTRFHRMRRLHPAVPSPSLRIRTVLHHYIETYRLAGQEVMLRDAMAVRVPSALAPIIAITVQVTKGFRQAEVGAAVLQALTAEPDAFFGAPPKSFGRDFFSGDLYQLLMNVEGVENLSVEPFAQRLGRSSASILEPSHGTFHLQLVGGRQP